MQIQFPEIDCTSNLPWSIKGTINELKKYLINKVCLQTLLDQHRGRISERM